MAAVDAFEEWFRSNGGYLHNSIRITHNETSGVHLRAIKPIEPGSTIISAPHALAIFYFNAFVDDALPIFMHQKCPLEAGPIAFFYLMTQYINRDTSFWKPYLDNLPRPDEDSSLPLFFEDADDVAWLEGTDVWYSHLARAKIYEKSYRIGITLLRESGIDVEPYTW